MLSVLAFKRALSAGILDGGTSEISLSGSRLNRFMKEVEKVSGRIPEGETITPAEEPSGLTTSITTLSEAASVTATTTLSEAASATVIGSDAEVSPSASGHAWIEQDSRTGAQSLRLPLQPPETASRIADALFALADALRGKRP